MCCGWVWNGCVWCCFLGFRGVFGVRILGIGCDRLGGLVCCLCWGCVWCVWWGCVEVGFSWCWCCFVCWNWDRRILLFVFVGVDWLIYRLGVFVGWCILVCVLGYWVVFWIWDIVFFCRCCCCWRIVWFLLFVVFFVCLLLIFECLVRWFVFGSIYLVCYLKNRCYFVVWVSLGEKMLWVMWLGW